MRASSIVHERATTTEVVVVLLENEVALHAILISDYIFYRPTSNLFAQPLPPSPLPPQTMNIIVTLLRIICHRMENNCSSRIKGLIEDTICPFATSDGILHIRNRRYHDLNTS